MYFTLSRFDQAPRQTRVEGHTRSTLEARRTASALRNPRKLIQQTRQQPVEARDPHRRPAGRVILK